MGSLIRDPPFRTAAKTNSLSYSLPSVPSLDNARQAGLRDYRPTTSLAQSHRSSRRRSASAQPRGGGRIDAT